MGGRSRRASSVPFVDVAEGAAADEVAAAEPRLDGGRHRRRVRHVSLPRDPAAGLGFWRAGIAAAFGRRLPPGARVWIRRSSRATRCLLFRPFRQVARFGVGAWFASVRPGRSGTR